MNPHSNYIEALIQSDPKVAEFYKNFDDLLAWKPRQARTDRSRTTTSTTPETAFPPTPKEVTEKWNISRSKIARFLVLSYLIEPTGPWITPKIQLFCLSLISVRQIDCSSISPPEADFLIRSLAWESCLAMLTKASFSNSTDQYLRQKVLDILNISLHRAQYWYYGMKPQYSEILTRIQDFSRTPRKPKKSRRRRSSDDRSVVPKRRSSKREPVVNPLRTKVIADPWLLSEMETNTLLSALTTIHVKVRHYSLEESRSILGTLLPERNLYGTQP